jgi:hypothetical protein
MGKPTTVHSARKGNLWPYTKVRKSGGKVKDPQVLEPTIKRMVTAIGAPSGERVRVGVNYATTCPCFGDG